MRADKPPWVQHPATKGKEKVQAVLYGLDISPNGERFATAGEDHKVRIWALRPVLHEAAEGDASQPRLLATLEEHAAPVNACRFSPDGLRLATGSDEHLVMVHELSAGPVVKHFGAVGPPAVENWKRILQMHGHRGNVTDVTWSPDGQLLASASLDNTVCIWNTAGNRVATLTGHESMVKGVAWDPVGTFLASQSDDKSVIVWRCEDWSVVTRVTQPFRHSYGSTFSLRLGWSPDGQTLTTANSYDMDKATAQVLTRGDWKPSFTFVGHTAPVVVVRFNPRLFRRPADEDNTKNHDPCCVVAIGSQDKQVTVWRTSRSKPLLLLQKFFDNTVIDMCWSPDGYGLLCCSLDGTVASFVFDPQELGDVMSGRETQAALERLYGDAAQRKGHAIIEEPALLNLQATAAAAAAAQQQARRVVPTSVAPTDAGWMSQPATAMPLASTPQREFRGTDGRRRIVPMAVGAPPPTSTGVSPTQVSRPPAVFGVSPALVGGGGGGSASQPPGGPSAFASAVATAGTMPPPQRRELTFPGGGEGSLPPFGGGGTASQPARRVVPQPVGPPPAAGLAPPPAPPARPAGVMSLSAQAPPAKRKATEALGPGPSTAAPPAVAPASSPQRVALLPVPGTQAALVAQLAAGSTSADGTPQPAVLLEARNTDAKCTLACSRGGEVLWRDVLPGAALALAGSPVFSAVSTSDGCLTIYTPAGRRALPPIALGGPAALMTATGAHLVVAATGTGALWHWHILPSPGDVTCLVHDSVAPLLAAAPPGTSIAALRLSAEGHPLAVLSNGQAYFLSPSLKAWARLADGHHLRSDFWSVLGSGGGEMAQLLAGAARGAVRSAGGPGPLLLTSSAPGGESARSETVRHVEAMVAAAVALHSVQDLRRWLPVYAAHLATDNQLARLRELLTELLGPTHWAEPAGAGPDAKGPGGWAPRLLGESKRELLQGLVLPAVAASRAAQRLCAEFVDLAAGVQQVQDAPAA